MSKKITKTDAEWRAQLSPEEYAIARRKGTERPFTGRYYHNKETGTYHCVCCGEPLFSSETKYESGSGWPSFWEPIDPDKIGEVEDNSHFMQRCEAVCKKCDAHLGHVLPGGLEQTGLRYCLNSAPLDLRKDPSGSCATG